MFIVFEGLDGSGKSTLIKAFGQWIAEKGRDYIVTREPGGSPLGDEIRHLLLRKDGDAPVPRAELLLYQAGRAQHVEKTIKPALDRGTWVLCDRYTASSLAFQCGGRFLEDKEIRWLNHYATSGLEPDLYVLIDLPVDVSRQRQNQRELQLGQEADRFESEKDQFHENVRNYYLKIAKEKAPPWLAIDGRLKPDEIFNKLKAHLLSEKKIS